MNTILEVNNLVLNYKIIKSNSLKKVALNRFRGRKTTNKEFMALRNVSFTIMEGDTVGIIGNNGAGKSTLLRVIAGVFQTYSGTITNNASCTSLLALGTGFVSELSGVENIFLSGLLQGLSKATIEDRLNEIIEFSGIADSVFQPVRTYSTGMKARLSFSISSHIDPDVLLIDELLGVGDKEFKEKSSSRIKEMIDEDRTVMLVSHNLKTVEEICNKVIWLEHGKLMMFGDSAEVIDAYKKK